MSRLSIFAAAAVLSALTATPVAFTKEHHNVRKAPQYINIVRPSQGYAIPRWSYAAPRPPVHYVVLLATTIRPSLAAALRCL